MVNVRYVCVYVRTVQQSQVQRITIKCIIECLYFILKKSEIRRFCVRTPGRITCLVGPTVRRLTTTFCPMQFIFLLHPTKTRVLLTSPRHTTTTIMLRNMPHTRIVFTPTYICTYQHYQYTPKSKTRDTQQKYK